MTLPSNLTLEERERIAYITGDDATAKLLAEAIDASNDAIGETYNDGYDAGYDVGYDRGYTDGQGEAS